MSSTREILSAQAALANAEQADAPVPVHQTAGADVGFTPAQFATIVALLEPIAECNRLMLPLIQAQRAEFDARAQAALAPPAPPSEGGGQSDPGIADPE
jgi:hypothetical protein